MYVKYLSQKYGNLDKFQRRNYIAEKGYNDYLNGRDIRKSKMSKSSRSFLSFIKDSLIDFVGGDIFFGRFSAIIYET